MNGQGRDVDDEMALPKLITELELKPEQIAVEINREVVRRANWNETVLREGDKVEIVHFVGGGNQEAEGRSSRQEQAARGSSPTVREGVFRNEN
ncbi:MAG TPA: sulfur carrier protein ThiS [Pyrinomonadaceae bacterium]|nr:sulfur carrier protein ThiS [Pyrinomonadaceae bacterium]